MVAALLPPVGLAGLLGAAWIPRSPLAAVLLLAGLILLPALAGLTVARRGAETVRSAFTQSYGEHQRAVVRVLLNAAMLAHAFGLAAAVGPTHAIIRCLVIASLGLIVAWAFFLTVIARPATPVFRRYLALACDFGLLSAFLHAGGGLTAAWYPLYAYLAIAGGWRFGTKAMLIAVLMSVAGFAIVVGTTPFWQPQPALAMAALAALLVLPASVAPPLRALAQASASARAANAEKSGLLSALGEELRRSLESILRASSTFDRTAPAAEYGEAVAAVRDRSRAMLAQLEDVGAWLDIEDGAVMPEVRPFDLYRLVNGVAATVGPGARDREIALAVRIDPRVPYALRGWPAQLRQALVGLLTEAVGQARGSEVGMHVLPVEPHGGHPQLRITISGRKAGTTHATLETATMSVFPRERDCPLNVAIAKRLIDLMGGRVNIRAAAGDDFALLVQLPIEVDHISLALPLDLAHRPAVIVSDDDGLADDLLARLERWRADSWRATTFEEALARLRRLDAGRPRPLLIIDGRDHPIRALAGAQQAIAAPPGKPAYILFITDERRVASVASLIGDEFGGILSAPFAAHSLQSAVHRYRLECGEHQTAKASPTQSSAPEQAKLPGAPAEAAQPPAELPGSAPAEGRSLHILAAASDAANRGIIGRILRGQGHALQLVANGEQVLEALRANPADVVLLDLATPATPDAASIMHWYLARPGLAIIALVSKTDTASQRLYNEAGIDAVLEKPIEPSRLVAAIETVARSDNGRHVGVLQRNSNAPPPTVFSPTAR
jgi:two-component system, sensor histidine kinase RpfC